MNRGVLVGAVLVVAIAIGGGVYYWDGRTCCEPPPVVNPGAPAQAPAAPASTAPVLSSSTPAPSEPTPAPTVAAAQPTATPSEPATAPGTTPPAAVASGAAAAASPGTTPAATPPPAAVPKAQPAATAAPATPVVPSFDIVRVDRTGEAVIAGRAEPGASITVLDGDRAIANITADRNGEWALTLDRPLGPGNHELGLNAKSAQDGTEKKSAGIVVVAVPDRTAQTAASAQPLAVLMPREGEGPAKALQVPGAAPSAADQGAAAGPVTGGGRVLVIEIVQYDGAGHLSVSGRAPANARVLLYLDNAPIVDTRADAKGDWTGKVNDPVAVGRHDLRADLAAQDGKVSRRVVLNFQRADIPTALAGNQFLVVQPGNSLWRIARHVYGLGPLYTEIYHANRSEIVDPNVIYPGQIVTAPPG